MTLDKAGFRPAGMDKAIPGESPNYTVILAGIDGSFAAVFQAEDRNWLVTPPAGLARPLADDVLRRLHIQLGGNNILITEG